MKSKVPAIILALGISAAPVFAKNSSRRADNKDSSRIEENKKAQKRVQKSYFRQKKIELEKEFIKETEMEINKVLAVSLDELKKSEHKARVLKHRELLLKDEFPANGIDISEEFLKIKRLS